MISPPEWGKAYRTYPKGAAIPGPRDPYLTPYIIEPELAIASGRYKRVTVITAAQSAKTEMMLDIMGWKLDQRPAPILYVGPNKQFLTEQFEPRIMNLLDEAPTLSGKVARGKRMTKTRKTIAGVSLRLAHAGSSAALKSDPAALALVDEYDEMLKSVKGQGDPLGLVERRGDTYPDFCCVVTSTCSKGMVQTYRDETSGLYFWKPVPSEDVYESPIWSLWQTGTMHHWTWPCPHCFEYFVPRFDLVKWPKDATPVEASRKTWMVCPWCSGIIENSHKTKMNQLGRFVAPGQKIDKRGNVTGDAADAPSISYWISGFASPFVTFGERIKSFLEAQAMGDDEMIQTAVNAGFGELYTPGGLYLKDWQAVMRRRGVHKFGEVPLDVLRLTCAVDVQKTSLIYSVRGWGARATSWQIESSEIAGFTNEPEIWNDLANVLHSSWGGLHLAMMLVDTGFRPDKPEEGSHNVAYQFCRRFSRVLATKGFDTLQAPVMRSRVSVTVPGSSIPVHINLARLDTDYWKSRVHERLAWAEGQPGQFHLSADATEDYCRQLVSEVRTVLPNGKPEWVRISKRNHFLDVEAMNEAGGHLLAAQKIPLGAARVDDAPPKADDEVVAAAAAASAANAAQAARDAMRGFAQRLNGR